MELDRINFSKAPGIKAPKDPKTSNFNAPEGLWIRCKNCHAILQRSLVEINLNCCLECDEHFRMGALGRIKMIADTGSINEFDSNLETVDRLEFFDSQSYPSRIERARKKTGLNEAFIAASATLDGREVQLGAFDFSFMGGSMGSVVGEKVARVFDRAYETRSPAIIFQSSGGARMQEGILSLMQMAKTTVALSRLKDAGIPYISVLTDPTTGGVAASFAMLGDISIAEPKALIGFAGPRVIQQTLQQKLPENFQRAEFLLEHGIIDAIVSRREMRQFLKRMLNFLCE